MDLLDFISTFVILMVVSILAYHFVYRKLTLIVLRFLYNKFPFVRKRIDERVAYYDKLDKERLHQKLKKQGII